MNDQQVTIVPSVVTVNRTITSVKISIQSMVLYESVTCRAILMAGNDIYSVQNVVISGEDYKNWGNDDTYIENFVLNVLGFTRE